MPEEDGARRSDLRQFKCECPGKYEHHKYRLWYERVRGDDPKSKCHTCEKMKSAIPRGKEEGVLICYFWCSCNNKFTVQCRMEDTAPCYVCRAPAVSPLYFKSRHKIVRMTSNTHNCSRCHGRGNCPNKNNHVDYCQ